MDEISNLGRNFSSTEILTILLSGTDLKGTNEEETNDTIRTIRNLVILLIFRSTVIDTILKNK